MKNTLYQINQDLIELFDTIEANEGEVNDDILRALEIKENELQEKSQSYYALISSQEAFIGSIDEEIKRLQALKKSRKSLVDRLKKNLLSAVELFGEFTVGTITFGTRKSTSVEVDDVNLLPEQYKKIKVTEQADKTLIKQELKSGVEITGCRIVENVNLKIK